MAYGGDIEGSLVGVLVIMLVKAVEEALWCMVAIRGSETDV